MYFKKIPPISLNVFLWKPISTNVLGKKVIIMRNCKTQNNELMSQNDELVSQNKIINIMRKFVII